ncbi:hypothetical protein [Defluviicoccus vanus]|uniref:Lipoprotein n=1 Tax=Defluviicoccus vanus TaxID=111831 RepID=A0A7H1N1I2_9PROT|nr:hypothetical protein [Defluviicoccus vanus]QNT69568.1 hypothetical protein HQ394_09795 [Defluviicoccus vanus]
MRKSAARCATRLGALIAATTVSGCAIFLPPHSKSNFREEEEVKIEMIKTCEELNQDIQAVFTDAGDSPKYDPYEKVFGPKCVQLQEPARGGGRESAVAAAVVAAAVGLAVDYVHDQLKKEATLYEAQWEQRIARDDFWSAGQMKYVGFRVTRTVEGKPGKPATTAVFAFHPSQDGQFFLVAPMVYRLERAKAKVLSDEWETVATPWVLLTFPGKFARIAGHSIDAQVAVEMAAFWLGKDDDRRTESIAAFVLPIRGYNLDKNRVLTPGDGLPASPVGWLAAVPRSRGADSPAPAGNFTLKVLVTEKDTSNAQQLLVQAADKLQEQKPAVQNYILKGLGVGTPVN